MKRYLAFLFILFSIKAFGHDFSRIDSIVNSGIQNRFYTGAQLIIGNENDIIYEKCYGRYTYDENSKEVSINSIFDLASVTKVIATTSAIMMLYEQGKIDLNDKVINYIPEFDNNGKNVITIKNLLAHNSGLKAWIPFYQTCKTREDALSIIYNTKLDYKTEMKFVYSDLNAILLGVIVEKVSSQDLNTYCKENIFLPLGMKKTGFNPERKNDALPTENDNYWRNKQLQGEVHDESAAIFGGISGNAGLFSNAEDLYLFMRMMLNKGKYYNPYTRGLKEEYIFNLNTIELFVNKISGLSYVNSRALGWDTKPEPNKYRTQCGELFSDNCFGHTGYTGTSVWCDHDRKLIVIFLTNRVYPSRGNEGIKEIRPEVHNEALRLLSNN